MSVRVLVVDSFTRAAARALVEFASKPENHYRPQLGAAPPGDNPSFVLNLTDFRCVFTFTVFNETLYRHLSISIPKAPAHMYPAPEAVEEIAALFGFQGPLLTGDPQYTRVGVQQEEHCVVAIQDVALPAEPNVMPTSTTHN